MHACDDKHAIGTQTKVLAQIYTIRASNMPDGISLEIDQSATPLLMHLFPSSSVSAVLSRPFSLHA